MKNNVADMMNLGKDTFLYISLNFNDMRMILIISFLFLF